MTYPVNTTVFPFQQKSPPTCSGTRVLCSKAVTQLMTHSVMPSPSKLLQIAAFRMNHLHGAGRSPSTDSTLTERPISLSFDTESTSTSSLLQRLGYFHIKSFYYFIFHFLYLVKDNRLIWTMNRINQIQCLNDFQLLTKSKIIIKR